MTLSPPSSPPPPSPPPLCSPPLRMPPFFFSSYRSESTAVQVASSGGRFNNAAEYVVTKLDNLVNWGRRVSNEFMYKTIYQFHSH